MKEESINRVLNKVMSLSMYHAPKIYLSGPITMYGDNNIAIEKFKEAEKKISDYHLNTDKFVCKPYIFNPAEFNSILFEFGQMDWADFMAFDFLILNQCDYIYMLPDWEKSNGATMEHDFALNSGRIKELLI